MATLKEQAAWFRRKERIKEVTKAKRKAGKFNVLAVTLHVFAEEEEEEIAVDGLKRLCIRKAEWVERARKEGRAVGGQEKDLAVMWAAVGALEKMQAAFRRAVEKMADKTKTQTLNLQCLVEVDKALLEIMHQNCLTLAKFTHEHRTGNFEDDGAPEREREPRSAAGG